MNTLLSILLSKPAITCYLAISALYVIGLALCIVGLPIFLT